ncbi:Nuclear receptor corepressor 1 [Rhynchospora pubera]|uniref:Nuclear receptor corepressor 1 n=1 Tax=Rhynchospora pubera TaxID=906938 RepID=A0AAV8FLQ5_9POAL|nr:Nuclear receptor corepressor 1 [Rhynchospora pubera]
MKKQRDRNAKGAVGTTQGKAQSNSSLFFFPSHVFPLPDLSLSLSTQPKPDKTRKSNEKTKKETPNLPFPPPSPPPSSEQTLEIREDDDAKASSEGHRCPLKKPSLMRSEQPTPPPPWERKERKFERGGSGLGSVSVSGDAPLGVSGSGSGSSSASATTSRWRDLRYGGPMARDSPHRPPSGHHRLYSEDSSSRSDRFYGEDERRHGRDNHNSCKRSPTLNSPSNFPRRPSYDTSIVTAARSLTIPVSTTSTKQPSSKDHTDSRDHALVPLSWKPLKWARPTSSALQSKDETTLKVLVPSVNEALVGSPVKSPSIGDETGSSRKKARLGWGQGLAKYEKEKVHGSVDSSGGPGDASSSGAVDVCVSGAADAGISGPVKAASCPSPVTPLSVTSRPPAIPAQMQCTATASTDGNNSHQNVTEPDTQPCSKDLPVKLDFSVNPVGSLSTLLANLLQPEEACMGDSMFMNKVSIVKIDILKELEKTECEIDSLELELKSLNSETKPVEAQQAQVLLPIEHFSETCLEATTECHKLITEEPVSSEKQESMPVDLTIEDYEGQAINRCSDEPSSSNGSDNTLALNKLMDKGTNLICSILTSNKDAAKLASQSIGIAGSKVDVWESVEVSCSKINNLRIKEKLAVRKRQMKFKNQVLALKFMALRQLWKEDMRLLNIKNNFTKSGKRVSLSSVPSQCTSQKLRSSVRSRLASSDDNSILVPSTEIIEYSSKLLSNSCIKQYRSYLKMPSLIVDNKEKENRRFPTKNSLIEDPVLFEHDRSMINPWTPEEKEAFMEMLATFGKDFTKISSFLDHKTTADCVEFYYKNHKSESFSEVKKRLLLKKKEAQLQSQQLAKSSAFLMATGRKWSRESNAAAAFDILGAASVVAAYNQGGLKSKQKVSSSKSRGSFSAVDRKESVAVNLPYHMGHAVSSEAMSSCVTTSTDLIGKTSHVRTVIEEDACSEESCGGELVSADWTDEEKALFVQAYSTHGKDFSKISHNLGTRSRDQCKVFFCKAQKSLGLDFTNHREDNGDAGGTPPRNGDTNGGRSDTDDVAAEMDSGICSTQSCSKAAGDVTTTSEAVAQPENANGSSEQEVVGAVVNSEIFDCFPPKQESIMDGYTDLNEKPVPEGEKCGSGPMLNESETASLICDDKASLPEIKEKINLEVAIKQSTTECAEAVSVSALHRSGICSTYLHDDVGERPIDTLTERMRPAHHVMLPHQAGTARSRRCASVDLGANSSVISFASDSGVSENVLAGSFGTSYFSQLSLEVRPVNNRSVQFGSEPVFSHPSSSICFSGNPHGLSHHSVPSTNNLLQECLQKTNPVVNQTNQSSHLLKGYPLQIPNHKGVKSEADFLGHMKISEFSQPSQFFGLNASNASNCQATGILTSQKRDEKCEFSVQPASQPAGSAVNDAHCRTGDVKLFGKILTQSSSEKVCTRLPSPKPNPKEFSSSVHNKPVASVTNGHSFGAPLFSRPAGISAGNQFGLDGLPVQSHGFWDGNKIQTGFPTLPESARMMVTHHDSLGGILPFYPGKDGNGSNILVNLSNYQQPHMQKLATNGGRVEGFSMTVPRRGGVEMGHQFPPNMVGTGAGLIRAGGVVSDPVVALKMHYTSNAKVCSSRGSGSGMESWSDVGR